MTTRRHSLRSSLHRRVFAASAVAAAAALTLSACGGASSSAAPGSDLSTPAGASPAASAAPTKPVQSAQDPVPVESSPPGDIPDNIAFVPYTNTAGGYSFTYPEGWARTESGTAVTFTDKLNGIHADVSTVATPITVDAVKNNHIPELKQRETAFELKSVTAVDLPAGSGVKVIFRRNSAPDPVTGRQYRDEVEEYLVASGGKAVRLDLFGPVGADNVDAYRTISQSLALS